MKTFNGKAIINEDFDNPIDIINIEATDKDEVEDLMVDLVYERRDDVDEDYDVVDIIDIEEV